jgi:hypothetical protein
MASAYVVYRAALAVSLFKLDIDRSQRIPVVEDYLHFAENQAEIQNRLAQILTQFAASYRVNTNR